MSRCSTDEPTHFLRSAHEFLQAQGQYDKGESNDASDNKEKEKRENKKEVKMLQRRQEAIGTDSGMDLHVEVYMHFVTSRDQAPRYSEEIVDTFTKGQVCICIYILFLLCFCGLILMFVFYHTCLNFVCPV